MPFLVLLRLAALSILACLAILAPTSSQAENAPEPAYPVEMAARALAAPPDMSAHAPGLPSGTAQILEVLITPESGWYFYANDPGAMGQPTRLAAETGQTVLTVLYPPGREKLDPFGSGEMVRMYEGATRLFVLMPEGLTGDVSLRARLLLCSDVSCLPAEVSRRITLTDDVASLPQAAAQAWWPDMAVARPDATRTEPAPASLAPSGGMQAAFSRENMAPRYHEPGLEVQGLFKAALLAVLAGFLLNLMPCVLPVASLKLKGLLSGCAIPGGEDDPVRCFRTFNFFFALGILSFFLFLAILLASLDLAWGQIFQSTTAVLAMAVLVFALSLSLFGVFTLPVVDLKAPVEGTQTRASAFFAGCLATLLATPCSGPFLGGVLAWTLAQPPLVIATVFVCIGLGMASPYLVMCIKPGIFFIFNLPGRWTLFVERVAGFFLAGTAVYLLTILPDWAMNRTLILLLATAFAAWMWGGWTSLSRPLWHRLATRGAALAIIVALFPWAANPPMPNVRWEAFDAPAFEEMLGKEPILADFTADWCPNCKFLEMTVLTEGNLARWHRRYGLRFVKVDLTREHPEAQALLAAMGSRSIPVVAVFPVGEKAFSPVVLRDLFTTPTLERVMERELTERR